MKFVTSWDDGHPDDLRLAELLAQRGFAGTFFVPLRNREGLPVLDAAGLRRLSQSAEVGSHTLDHVYADRMPSQDWARQVVDGKRALEDVLGHAVDGFCYPGGKRQADSAEIVRQAGFRYARTTENARVDLGPDRWSMPTTLQCFAHTRRVVASNWLTQGHWGRRSALCASLLLTRGLQARLRRALEFSMARDGVFHLWGHSWELSQAGLWEELDEFLVYAAARVAPADRVTCRQLSAAWGGGA